MRRCVVFKELYLAFLFSYIQYLNMIWKECVAIPLLFLEAHPFSHSLFGNCIICYTTFNYLQVQNIWGGS